METGAGHERVKALDHIRGLSILGILLVNAIAFAQPMDVYDNPSLSPLSLSHADMTVWWLTEVFFREKFVTLFSMLFGVSMYLVGRDQGDGVPAYKTPLFRRLAWLVLFGTIHGALVWHGDILLSYAVTGFVFWPWRNAPAGRLIGWGLFLFLVGAATLLIPMLMIAPGTQPEIQDIGAMVATMRGTFWDSLGGNFGEWSKTIFAELMAFLPTTLGLMMIGAGLFKAGVLSGRASTRLYCGLIVAGALSLVVIAWQVSQMAAAHFRYPETYGAFRVANTVLCLVVSLGYAGALILLARTPVRILLYPLACAGRMAFTNYLCQSLVMTSLFYGGRGPAGLSEPWSLPWFGEMNAAGLLPIVATIWIAQLIFSTLWMSLFRYGPFEWVWRCLTYQRWVGLLKA